MRLHGGKIELASKITNVLGISKLSRKLLSLLYPGHIRVLNYHHVPEHEMPAFVEQIDYLLSVFDPATPEDLANVLEGKRTYRRPSFILTFDDGFESHGTYVAEYLKQKNIKAWFFVPTEAPDLEPVIQAEWAIDHNVLHKHESAIVNGRVFAEWSTWERWSDFHVIGSHTHSHLRFKPEVPRETVKNQLSQSLKILKNKFNKKTYPLSFCWVGGELGSYSSHATEEIKNTKVKYSFTTCSRPITSATNPHRIERTNLESSFSIARVKMSVSGIVDIRYFLKRRALNGVFFPHSART